ncbi:adenosylcobinamide-GDP ribazoletransferase [Gordonia hirsuta]|nr:adenosylcobinamide-GDP ribazoletransferase [Gordonia hirsuta]
MRSVWVATAWLTVLPVPQPSAAPDRRIGAHVISAVPVIGVLLGSAAAALAFGLHHTALPAALIGALIVAFDAVATRGMHLDGLADTADGLGCYGDPERTRAVMRSGDVGPFGAAAMTMVLLLQTLAIGALVDQHRWTAIVFAVFLGRVSVVIACRRGLGPANADGFGALVSGTQRWSILVWLLVSVAAALGAGAVDPGPGDPVPGDSIWTGAGLSAALPALTAVVVVAVAVYLFTRHCARRMGGTSGDVLGATLELSTTIALVVLLW